MGTIISWVRGAGGWVRSPFGDLPMLRVDDAAVHQTWLILAGGMGLILSRASKSELETRFAATKQVYVIARNRLEKRKLPKPEPGLLRDALQEIANLTDPMTKEAGRECLARCVERAAKARAATAAPAAAAGAAQNSALPSQQSTHSTQSTQSTQSTHSASTPDGTEGTDDHEATRIDLDLLFERSNKLRGTVAWARSTTFGQDP